jgi:hypothetical protein
MSNMNSSEDGPTCTKCGTGVTGRVKRRGLLHRTLIFKLRHSPRQCRTCWKPFWSRKRGRKVSLQRVPQERLASIQTY